jgi:site-specific recombinase XerD
VAYLTSKMTRVDRYLEAAESKNTSRSYASAIRHFEIEWKGLLPASAETVARYLADHAETLSANTLQHRLAALSRWHTGHGFPDPTKAPMVRQVLRGIRTVHPAQEKRAKPLQLDVLQQVDAWLQQAAQAARARGDRAAALRHARDRALVLLGFWRGFRSDELVRLQIEHVDVTHGEGLTCFIPRSKGDRNAEGRTFRCPALSRLCPVAAYEAWLAVSGLNDGPVFRAIDRWGRIAPDGLAAASIIPLLRRLFGAVGLTEAQEYSSHSLRRGFAGWANANGWDLKELMEYVGWRDIKSALRYLEASPQKLRERFERGLPEPMPSPVDLGKPVRLKTVPS